MTDGRLLPRTRRETGQALIEFVVAIVSVLVLAAGLLQIGKLAFEHTNCMIDANREAARISMDPDMPVSGPGYIREWLAGDDESVYSRDDEPVAGDTGEFITRVVDYGRPASLDRHVPDNPVSALDDDPYPHLTFGLVQGRETRDVPLIPAIRRLVYRADRIDVVSESWTVWTYGLY